MRHIIHIAIVIAILGGGFIAFNSLKGCESNIFSDKEANATKEGKGKGGGGKKGGGKRKPTIKTKVLPLEKIDYSVEVISQGEIQAHHDTSLTSHVAGRIIKISPKFENGAFFNKGDTLVELDVADFLTDIQSAKAQLARAESAFAQEEARAKQALQNWQDAGFDEEPSDLVLRKPQLREAQADVISSQSSLERAERALKGTKIKAPYNGRVRVRNIGIGQQVGANTPLGEIFTSDIAIVRLPITSRDLSYYSPPNKPSETSSAAKNNVTFTSTVATHGDSSQWTGSIIRTEGVLDEDSRQIFVIARIEDPFGLKSNKDSLYLGQPVRVTIPAHVLKGVYKIPRSGLSDLNQIIVIREGVIKRIDINPIWSTQDHIIFRDNILAGDRLATTRIPYAPEGSAVEIMPDLMEKSDTNADKKGSK